MKHVVPLVISKPIISAAAILSRALRDADRADRGWVFGKQRLSEIATDIVVAVDTLNDAITAYDEYIMTVTYEGGES